MGMLLAPNLIASMKSYGIKYAALFDGSTGYQSRTFGPPTDVKKYTLRARVMRWEGATGGNQYIFTGIAPNGAGLYISATTDKLYFYTGNSVAAYLITTQVLRDFGSFYEIQVDYDSANATATERVRIFINGVRVTALDTAIYPALNDATSEFNSAAIHYIGTSGGVAISGIYITEPMLIDGANPPVTDFGKFDSVTGNWVARKYTGAYGANGFCLDFSDSAYLGLNAHATGAFSTNLCRNGTSSVDVGNAVNLSECFDGDQSDLYASPPGSPYVAGSGILNFYAGKDWGVGVTKTITGFRLFPIADYYGYCTVTSGTMTIKLQGSTDNFVTSIVDLHSASGIAQSTTNIYTVSSAITTTTSYRYHRIMMYEDTPYGLSHAVCLSEVEFFEAGNYAIDGHWNTFGGLSQVTSTPTNVYATWNPLAVAGHGSIYTNGNRTSQNTGGYDSHATMMMEAPTYWEETLSGITFRCGVGITNYLYNTYNFSSVAGCCGVMETGQVFADGVLGATYTSFGDTNRIGQCFDPATGQYWYRVNGGAWANGGDPVARTGAATSIAAGLKCVPMNYSSTGTVTAGFAESEWVDAAPTGFKALCTDNLPKITDSIDNHFRALKYVGNGAATQRTDVVWGGAFQPNFVWGKNRSAIADHYIHDELRGVTNALASNLTAAQSGPAGFASDGFGSAGVLDQFRIYTANAIYNALGQNYITFGASLPKTASTWGFGETITPSGEIYNDSAMFKMSVVTATMDGSALNRTIPHTLGTKPGLIIGKDLSAASGWFVYHSSLGAGSYMDLFSTAASVVTSNSWGGIEPTTQLFTVGASMTSGLNNYVFYIFAPCDGIKIGSYLGNASSDGPFLNENISPIWLLHKADAVANWNIWDATRSPGNPVKETLVADSSGVEDVTYNRLDFTSGGMKGRDGTVHPSSFTGTNLYMMIGQPSGPTENRAR